MWSERTPVRLDNQPRSLNPDVIPDNRHHRRERQFGPFARTIRLGERFDPDRVEATYRDGILRIRVSRAVDTTPRKITIESWPPGGPVMSSRPSDATYGPLRQPAETLRGATPVLRVTIPKSAAARPKKIAVRLE
jgi:Hsp20/alpha crystallin family protein